MKNLSTFSLALLLVVNVLQAQIINVPADYSSIQQGIDAAENGDTVLVAPGTYYENISISKSLVVASHYLTTLDTSYISATIIDGGQNDAVVRFVAGEGGNNSYMHGFTIVNGYNFNGGGVCLYGHKSVEITQSVIMNNQAQHGGGMYNSINNLKLINVKLLNNYAVIYGGGICNGNPNWAFDVSYIVGNNVVVKENEAGEKGGGFWDHTTGFEFYNSSFINNSAKFGGGLWYDWEGVSLLENVKVLGNTATEYGGGIYVGEYSFYEFRNVEIGNNHAKRGGGLFLYGPFGFHKQFNLLVHDNVAESMGGGIYHSYGLFKGVNVTIANNEAETGTGIYCVASDLDLKTLLFSVIHHKE